MSENKVKVGKWDVPKELYDEYIRFRLFADFYALNKADPSRIVPMQEQERSMRWLLCVQKVMEVHRKICEVIGVPYSEDPNDEFYEAFHSKTNEDSKLGDAK